MVHLKSDILSSTPKSATSTTHSHHTRKVVITGAMKEEARLEAQRTALACSQLINSKRSKYGNSNNNGEESSSKISDMSVDASSIYSSETHPSFSPVASIGSSLYPKSNRVRQTQSFSFLKSSDKQIPNGGVTSNIITNIPSTPKASNILDDKSYNSNSHQKSFNTRRKNKDYSTFFSVHTSALIAKTTKVTKNAFMCGMCGNFYTKKKYAYRHESQCIVATLCNNHLFQSLRYGLRSLHTTAPVIEVVHHVNPYSNALSHYNQTSFNYNDYNNRSLLGNEKGRIILSHYMLQFVVMTDATLINTVRRTQNWILTKSSLHSERELGLISRDRSYYDIIKSRRKYSMNSNSGIPVDGDENRGTNSQNKKRILYRIRRRFAQAYELIKEGTPEENSNNPNHSRYNYSVLIANNTKNTAIITNTTDTIYINVMVKQSALLLNNELERKANYIWRTVEKKKKEHKTQFERIRYMAHVQTINFAKLAMKGDVAPERASAQLSNDLHKNLTPICRRCGVEIETAVEYINGPYFILSVNIQSIDWIIIMNHMNKQVTRRRGKEKKNKKNCIEKFDSIKTFMVSIRTCQFSLFDFLEKCLAFLYHLNWTISVPICTFLYGYVFPTTLKAFILTSVTEDFFKYAEKKGLDMDLLVKTSMQQSAFMLSAIHHIGKYEREKAKETKQLTDEEKPELTRGALLGPFIVGDELPIQLPDTISLPPNLEHEILVTDVLVGYRRLRWAMLHNSTFFVQGVFTDALNYTEIKYGEWNKYQGLIGLPTQTDESTNESDFIGATLESQYMMPKSAFVKANMVYDQVELQAYNDYFFVLKKKTRTPDVPFGNSFLSWTQILVQNTGENSCRITFSVEAEFPNGRPMVANQIENGLKKGTFTVFVHIRETISKYCDFV